MTAILVVLEAIPSRLSIEFGAFDAQAHPGGYPTAEELPRSVKFVCFLVVCTTVLVPPFSSIFTLR